MSILPMNNERGGRMAGRGIMSPYAVEANRRRQYLAEVAKAGGIPENDNSRFNPSDFMTKLGRISGRQLVGTGGMVGNMNREAYINMADAAGGLPAMASGRRMVDRFAAENAAAARPSGGTNVLSSALNRLAGNFVDDRGGLQIVPGAINTGLDMQRGIQNAAGSAVMGGARALPGIGRGIFNLGKKAGGVQRNILEGIYSGLF